MSELEANTSHLKAVHDVLCFLQVKFYFHCLAYEPTASLCFMLQYKLDLLYSFQDATTSAHSRSGRLFIFHVSLFRFLVLKLDLKKKKKQALITKFIYLPFCFC